MPVFAPLHLRDDEATRDPAWSRALRRGIFAYLLTRILVLLGGGVAITSWAVQLKEKGESPETGFSNIAKFLDMWDGHWYLDVVRMGYPRDIQDNVTYFVSDARAAFFPLYPRMVHYIDKFIPGGPVLTALLVNFILGAMFIYLAGRIALRLFDTKVAEKAMIVLCLFPGSFVLSFAYSEATLLVLACLCLIALTERSWLWAGVFAGLGSLARPNGLALAFACGVAAIIAIRDRRDWSSLIAPALAPTGFIGFMLFLRHHTGEPWAWFRVQNEAWDEGTSFGVTALKRVADFVIHPVSSPTSMMTVFSLVLMGVMLWAAKKHRLPAPHVAYSLVVLGLMLIPETVTARPRFLFTAFPLLLSCGALLRDEDGDRWLVIVAVLSAGLVCVSGLYGVYGIIP